MVCKVKFEAVLRQVSAILEVVLGINIGIRVDPNVLVSG